MLLGFTNTLTLLWATENSQEVALQVLNDQEATKAVRRKRAEAMAVMGKIFHETAEGLVQTYAKASKEEVNTYCEYNTICGVNLVVLINTNSEQPCHAF